MLTFFLAFFIFSGFRKGRVGFSRSTSCSVSAQHQRQEGDGRELQPRRRPLHPADRGRVERVAPRLQENQVVGDPLVSAPRMYVTVRERDAWRARLPLHSRGSRSV